MLATSPEHLRFVVVTSNISLSNLNARNGHDLKVTKGENKKKKKPPFLDWTF